MFREILQFCSKVMIKNSGLSKRTEDEQRTIIKLTLYYMIAIPVSLIFQQPHHGFTGIAGLLALLLTICFYISMIQGFLPISICRQLIMLSHILTTIYCQRTGKTKKKKKKLKYHFFSVFFFRKVSM
jgi:hypothetical protein